MSKTKYHLSAKAKRDIDEIWEYTISSWSESQADNYYREIINALDGLIDRSQSTQDFSDIRPGLQRIRVRYHYIFYQLNKDGCIEVIRVLHERMNIPKRLIE